MEFHSISRRIGYVAGSPRHDRFRSCDPDAVFALKRRALAGGEGQSAHMALFSVDARRLWYVVKLDAFLSTLVYVPGWSWQGRPVSLLTLDYGAGAEEAGVIALDRRGLPNMLDRRSASDTALLPDGGPAGARSGSELGSSQKLPDLERRNCQARESSVCAWITP